MYSYNYYNSIIFSVEMLQTVVICIEKQFPFNVERFDGSKHALLDFSKTPDYGVISRIVHFYMWK